MLYETLKWPQIAPDPDPLPLSRIMAFALLSLRYAPADSVVVFIFHLIEQYYRITIEFA